MGQTTSVGIGGDPVMGLSFPDVLQLLRRRPGDARRGAHRRDRWLRRGDRGGVDPRDRVRQAGGRVHLRTHRTARQAHGPRRRDHQRDDRAARRARSTRSPRPALRSPTPSRTSCASPRRGSATQRWLRAASSAAGWTGDAELGREQVWEDALWRLTTSVGPGDVTPGFSYLEPKRHIAQRRRHGRR